MSVDKSINATPIAVLMKTGGKCSYCDADLNLAPYDSWKIDHWAPEERFSDARGTENLWPACCPCTDEKGNDTGEDYIVRRKAEGRRFNKSAVVMQHFTRRSV